MDMQLNSMKAIQTLSLKSVLGTHKIKFLKSHISNATNLTCSEGKVNLKSEAKLLTYTMRIEVATHGGG